MPGEEILRLDWAIYLSEIASEVSLVHRRNEFRGALDSVEKVSELSKIGKINLITEAEVVGLKGEDKLESVVIRHGGDASEEEIKETDYFIPLFRTFTKTGTNWELGS